MPLDDLLRLTGASAGVHRETATVDAAGGGGWRFLGPNKSFQVEITFGGLFDRTTGDETMGGFVQIADDAAGTNPVTVATATAAAANNRGLGSTATQDSLGMVTPPQRINFSTTATKQYARWSWDASGTTPSAAGAVATIIPARSAVLRSGV